MTKKSGWSSLSRHARGYGSSWDKIRKRIMQRDGGLCQVCMAKGKSAIAYAVDHIKSKSAGGTDDDGNLRAICRDCHRDKTAQDAGRTAPRRIGLDGWPVE